MNRNHVHRPEPELDLTPELLVLATLGGLLALVVGWLFVVLFVGIFG